MSINKMFRRKKHKNLQPWLSYFDLLAECVESGYLQLDVMKHECYITQPAIHAISKGDDPMVQIYDGSIGVTANRLRTYAGWLSCEGKDYVRKPFAVHIVEPDGKNEPICTILLSWSHGLFGRRNKTKVVVYPRK